jgi:hypothetical protein
LQEQLKVEKTSADAFEREIAVLHKNLVASRKEFQKADKQLNETLLQSCDIVELENSFNDYMAALNYTTNNIKKSTEFVEKFHNCKNTWLFSLVQYLLIFHFSLIAETINVHKPIRESSKFIIKRFFGDFSTIFEGLCIFQRYSEHNLKSCFSISDLFYNDDIDYLY